MFSICLFQPEIPQNTGNILRTCAVTGSSLILVRPLGFSLASRHLKRAGLDYCSSVPIQIVDDLESVLQNQFYFFSSKATKRYTEIKFHPSDQLIFGSEGAGLPSHFWQRWPNRFYTIPQRKEMRCLNLANAVAIVLYEAWRQHNFAGS